MNPITIRPIKNVEGCNQFTELQRRIWGSPELDLVPNHVLITCLKNGGAILGAEQPFPGAASVRRLFHLDPERPQ